MNSILADIDREVLEDLEESMYIAFLNRNVAEVITILTQVRNLLGNPTEFNVQSIVRDLLFGSEPTTSFMARILKEYNQDSETQK